MQPEIQRHLEAIRQLCTLNRVQRLMLIGSAADGMFDADTSDFDFVVEFESFPREGLRDPYFRLWQALEDLLGRPVDLIEYRAVSNPRFRETIEQDQQVLYAA